MPTQVSPNHVVGLLQRVIKTAFPTARSRKTISVNCDLKDERKDYLVPTRRIFFHGAVDPRVENKNRKARFHRAVISPDLVTPGLAADSFRAPAILGNSACRRPRILPMACGARDR